MNSFKKQENPLVSLGIGQVNLITKWFEERNFTANTYKINEDLSVDYFGNCHIGRRIFAKMEIFPDYIQFNIVYGDFSCDTHKLISLRGCPRIVEGSFYCKNNNLTTLEGCPKKVAGVFNCRKNKVKFTEHDVRKLCKVKKYIYV
jgi:hypothetical protein